MMKQLLLLTIFVSFHQISFADDIILDEQQKQSAIRDAIVWNQPNWVSDDFQFASDLDVYGGPKAKGYTKHLAKNNVYCRTTQSNQMGGFGGKTPKFYCNLLKKTDGGTFEPILKKSGKPRKVKIKYSPEGEENNEVYGEVVGTRLLWALGFGADQMFPIEKAHCFGCTEHPFADRRVDRSTIDNPRVFEGTVSERKMKGDEYITKVNGVEQKGVSFRDMMSYFSKDPETRDQQFARRDALRLLAAFMHHTDLKAENQRFICPDKVDENGKCQGKPMMMIQDIGASFGVKLRLFPPGLEKMDLETWKSKPVWKWKRRCVADVGLITQGDLSMVRPKISEQGRQFLAKLLNGFTKGPEGRERVRDLFRAARVEERGNGETVEDWTDAFMMRVRQINNARCKMRSAAEAASPKGAENAFERANAVH